MKYKDIKDTYKEYIVSVSITTNPRNVNVLSIAVDDLEVINIDCDLGIIELSNT